MNKTSPQQVGAPQIWYLVNSDNLEDCILSEKDYQNLRLEMSTGDFHSHSAIKIERELTDEEWSKAMYWDEEEQALLPY